jgi:hypothetical protein
MELFLNLCWLSLLVPAYLLWRLRTSSTDSKHAADHPLVLLCTLGCALILLFPVISATDDLHAMRPEMEESERAFRDSGHHGGTLHAPSHSSQLFLSSSNPVTPTFEQIGTVLWFIPQTPAAFSAPASASRAPPSEHPFSL